MTFARQTVMMRLKFVGVVVVALFALIFAVAGSSGTVNAASGPKAITPLFDPPSIAHPSGNSSIAAAHAAAATAVRNSGKSNSVVTVPYWNSFFSYPAGSDYVYSYQMVGTNPANGSATTRVPTVIVPINLTFADGTHFNGSQKVASTVSSPIWRDAYYNSGHTQYTNALQRAEFWKYTQKENYNVLLESPTVQAPVNWTVPAADAQPITSSNGVTYEEVSIDWWYPQVLSLLSSRHLSAKVLPIFLTYDTVLYEGSPANCCVIGYHDAVVNQVGNKTEINTYAWASWTDPGFFSVPIDDVNALSHEVAEWMNDPFTDNTVPPWSVPSEPQYGCSNVLEVGDPLVGVTSYINGYHLQDEAFFSWFARQSPSIGINGQYSMFGTFDAPAPGC